jgi:hypothetical protein
VVVDIHSTVRNERALDEVVNRINIEPGIIAVSWEKVPRGPSFRRESVPVTCLGGPVTPAASCRDARTWIVIPARGGEDALASSALPLYQPGTRIVEDTIRRN